MLGIHGPHHTAASIQTRPSTHPHVKLARRAAGILAATAMALTLSPALATAAPITNPSAGATSRSGLAADLAAAGNDQARTTATRATASETARTSEQIIPGIEAHGVAVDQNYTVYVIDGYSECVQVWRFDASQGEYVNEPNLRIPGNGPSGVAVDSDGTLFIGQSGEDRVSVWRLDAEQDKYVNVQNITGFTTTAGVAVDQNHNVYVSDDGTDTVSVWRFDATANEYVPASVPTIGDGSLGQVNNGLAVDKNGNVYIGETDSSGQSKVSIWRLNAEGSAYVPASIPAINGLTTPQGIAVAQDHTVYVAEPNAYNGNGGDGLVSVWRPDTDLGQYVAATVPAIDVKDAWGVALDANDDVFIASTSQSVYGVTPPTAAVTGHVVSARDGSVPSGTVSVVKPSDAGDGTYMTVAGPFDIEPDGSFTIDDVVAGSGYLVQVDADGYDTGYSDTFSVTGQPVTLPDPISVVPNYQITTSVVGETHGTIDVASNPVSWKGTGKVTIMPEADYSISRVTDTAEGGTATDVTDQTNAKHGVYQITGVDQAHQVAVEFAPGRTVWGTVTDKDGEGVPDASVSVVQPSGDGGEGTVVAGPALSDSDGDFGIPEVPDGNDYELVSEADGYDTGHSGPFDVNDTTGDGPNDLTLDKMFTVQTVAGTTGTVRAADDSVVQGGDDQVRITPGAGFVIDKVKDTAITDGKTGDPVDVTDQLVDNGDGTFTLTLADVQADHVVYASFKPGGTGATNPGGTTPGGSGSTGTTPGGPGPTTPPPAGPTVVKVKAAIGAATLVKGKSYKLVALAYTADGVNVPVTYKSSKAKIATVSASGKVKAKKPGKAIITITSGSQMTKVKVTVLKKRPSSAASKVKKVTVKLKKKLKTGQIVYLTPKLGPKTALAVKITFKSAKKKVATIDKVGRLMALKKGKTTITVKAGKTAKKLKLTVK